MRRTSMRRWHWGVCTADRSPAHIIDSNRLLSIAILRRQQRGARTSAIGCLGPARGNQPSNAYSEISHHVEQGHERILGSRLALASLLCARVLWARNTVCA
jgi:hypothetical protein